jgi:hypothetical protein
MNKNLLSLIDSSYDRHSNDDVDDDDDNNYELQVNCGKRRKLTENERILRWYVKIFTF